MGEAKAVGYLDVASDEMSQTFTDPPTPPLTIRFPSGLQLAMVTKPVCPLNASVSCCLTTEGYKMFFHE